MVSVTKNIQQGDFVGPQRAILWVLQGIASVSLTYLLTIPPQSLASVLETSRWPEHEYRHLIDFCSSALKLINQSVFIAVAVSHSCCSIRILYTLKVWGCLLVHTNGFFASLIINCIQPLECFALMVSVPKGGRWKTSTCDWYYRLRKILAVHLAESRGLCRSWRKRWAGPKLAGRVSMSSDAWLRLRQAG